VLATDQQLANLLTMLAVAFQEILDELQRRGLVSFLL
jgi:hypothetical protein